VAAAGVRVGDLVLDIGAGHGAITAPLVQAGARVLAVELHPQRVRRLRDRFAEQPVTVVPIDARELQLPHRPFRVVASPPYAISTELLRLLLSPQSALVSADLVLQRGFVRRFAESWQVSRGRAQRRWEASLGPALPRSAFDPPPQVDSAVLLIRRR
jgi:23S rRNA (adenine-N6)-dimethyltransferase